MQRKRDLVGTVDLIQGDEPGRPNNVHTYISSQLYNLHAKFIHTLNQLLHLRLWQQKGLTQVIILC